MRGTCDACDTAAQLADAVGAKLHVHTELGLPGTSSVIHEEIR